MYQSWHDLLFMHWPIPIESLQPLIPTGLDIDTFNHQAWIAVVPFRMSHIHPRGLFPVPWLSAFAELNVRTYVIRDGKPGVWFFSLEAANPVAVWLARSWFKLPYFNATMTCKEIDRTIHYSSHRTHRKAPSCDFKGSYAPIENIQFAQKGSLEHFFTARYCLYTSDKNGRLYRGEIDHEPWPLQRAKATIQTNTMTSPLNIALSGPPLLHFSKSIQVRVWELEAL
jgi:uncharacterized protein YqjF (DUF2071 family)